MDSVADQTAAWRARFLFGLLFCVPVLLLLFVFPHTPVAAKFDARVTRGLTVRNIILWICATLLQSVIGLPVSHSP